MWLTPFEKWTRQTILVEQLTQPPFRVALLEYTSDVTVHSFTFRVCVEIMHSLHRRNRESIQLNAVIFGQITNMRNVVSLQNAAKLTQTGGLDYPDEIPGQCTAAGFITLPSLERIHRVGEIPSVKKHQGILFKSMPPAFLKFIPGPGETGESSNYQHLPAGVFSGSIKAGRKH